MMSRIMVVIPYRLHKTINHGLCGFFHIIAFNRDCIMKLMAWRPVYEILELHCLKFINDSRVYEFPYLDRKICYL
jgi:hypothetical protein